MFSPWNPNHFILQLFQLCNQEWGCLVLIIDSELDCVVECLCGFIKYRDLAEGMGSRGLKNFLHGRAVAQLLTHRA